MFKSLNKFLFKSFSVSHLFTRQVHACKTMFVEKKHSDFFPLQDGIPDDIKHFKGTFYDITGFSGEQIIALLRSIVNDNSYTMNKTYYLFIRNSNRESTLEEDFRLRARPTKNQPGNGIVFLRPTGKKLFTQSAKSYEELNGALQAHYKNTKEFAQDFKQLLKNNAKIDDLPQATFEAYMILLFEIARRLVQSEKPNEKKEQLDILPIASAIVGLIQLLESGKAKFEDVFLPGGKFHCFTGTPEVRERAIERINEVTFDSTKQDAVTEEDLLKELEDLFGEEEQLEEKLKALTVTSNHLPAPIQPKGLPVDFQTQDAERDKEQLEKKPFVDEHLEARVMLFSHGIVLPDDFFQPSEEEGYTAFDYLYK